MSFVQSANLPVTMRLYPLQRLDGRVLLTVDYTPQGQPGEDMSVQSSFCYAVVCSSLESVSLIDTVGMTRYAPLRQVPPEESDQNPVFGSFDRWADKEAGVTYRFGVFFPDPGTSTISVDLVHGGVVPDVPIVDGGPTAPELVAPGPATVSDDTARPEPIESGGDQPTLVTMPAPTPPGDAIVDNHRLVAPILGGKVTDYTGMVNLNADLLFAFDSAKLTPQARSLLADAVAILADKADPTKPLLVTGHTDNVGGPSYNDRLSLQRARSVAEALDANPATSSWPKQVAGKGENEPVAPNTTSDGNDDPAGRALNRRVEIAYTPKPVASPTPSTPASTAATAALDLPAPAATLGPVTIKSHGAAPGQVTAQVYPVAIDGGLALVRLTISPRDEVTLTDAFGSVGGAENTGRFWLTDTATKTSYLAAHDEDDPDRTLGTLGGHVMEPGRSYSYFVYTAPLPADLTTVTVDLGQLGTADVPVER